MDREASEEVTDECDIREASGINEHCHECQIVLFDNAKHVRLARGEHARVEWAEAALNLEEELHPSTAGIDGDITWVADQLFDDPLQILWQLQMVVLRRVREPSRVACEAELALVSATVPSQGVPRRPVLDCLLHC
jgi:hypothetical protein